MSFNKQEEENPVTTFEIVRTVLAVRFQIGEDKITENTHIFEDLCHRDMLDWFDVQTECEYEFKIGNIDDEELDRETATIKHLIELIDQKVAAKTIETTGQ